MNLRDVVPNAKRLVELLVWGASGAAVLIYLVATIPRYSSPDFAVVPEVIFWAMLLLVPSTLAHELGHALAGRSLGMKTRDIQLGAGRRLVQIGRLVVRSRFWRGGLTRYVTGRTMSVSQATWLSLSGPMTNIALASLGVILTSRIGVIGWGLTAANLMGAGVSLYPSSTMVDRVRVRSDGGTVLDRWRTHPRARTSFERLTPGCKLVLVNAKQAAESSGEAGVGTEHILWALTVDILGNCGKALTQLGVTQSKVEEQIAALKDVNSGTAAAAPASSSAGMERALSLAFGESQTAGLASVGPDQLLLGIIAGGQGTGAQILRNLDVTEEKARRALKTAGSQGRN